LIWQMSANQLLGCGNAIANPIVFVFFLHK
jgi:hypothetical protein